MPLIVVYNPACGDKTASAFFREQVLPLLEGAKRTPTSVLETKHEGHAGEIISDLSTSFQGEDIDIILGSGDGTLHEIINGLFAGGAHSPGTAHKIRVILVPCGTANALYSSLYPPSSPEASTQDIDYRLQALRAYVNGKSSSVPLSFAVTTLHGSSKNRKPLVSSVVISTSLHAAILRDSERLRDEHPGIERFKIAAQENSDKWYRARVQLLPLPDGRRAEIYDPNGDDFRPFDSGEGVVELEGPFAYFLSTVNVDRLEPAFNITPLARRIAPPSGTCDLVVVRPLRDPSIAKDDSEVRRAFVPKLWGVLGGAYQDGAHVKLRYNEKGEIVTDGEGELVVEYLRSGGWRWIPDEDDDGAHWLCSDGFVVNLERGESVECKVSTKGGNLTVSAGQ